MSLHRGLNKMKAEPSYSLEYLTTKKLGQGKYHVEHELLKGVPLGSLRWHKIMQKHFKKEYCAYGLIDCVRVEEFDEEVEDVTVKFPLLIGDSQFKDFSSNPKQLCDDFHSFCLEHDYVISTTSDRMKHEFDAQIVGKELWINKLQDAIARNKKSSIAGSITTLATGTVVQKQEESVDKTDKPAIVEEDKEEKSMDKPEDKPEDKEPDDDGDDFESKKAKLHSKLDELAVDYTDDAIDIVNNIIDEAEEGQDMSDLIPEEVDNACIYFNDCFDYLKVSHNTDFKDAIDNGLNDVTSIAAWYMEEEVSELLGKVTNSDD
jgi:hypothetical protein